MNHSMHFIRTLFTFTLMTIVSQNALAANQEFPGRDIHLSVPYIEMADLKSEFNQVVMVDVRSKYEYDTLKITGAVNVPLHNTRFVDELKQVRSDNKGKKIVVYCNGKTCMKSYKAVEKANIHSISNVVAFDTGIMDWAKQNPELAVLLGKSPVDPAKLIGKNQFEAHLAEATAFAEMMQKENIQVLDVRDRFQRSGVSLFVGVEVQAELDDEEKINRIIEKAVANKTTMLIYDESGKQVRWLQYRLEELGLKNYVFLKGGTREYFKLLKTRMRG